jgi:Ser/Thr protein kinase RdoA (MazF antagonist)
LHIAWANLSVEVGACPGIQRRLQRADEWRELISSGWRPSFAVPGREEVRHWAERAWVLLQHWSDHLAAALAPWVDRTFSLQPCLCDIWHDHVLFEEDTFRGFIDFGGVKVDHVSVDLARLLGSMVGDDAGRQQTGLAAYARVRPISPQERAFVKVLDETGTIIGMQNWLKWLYWEGKSVEDVRAVANRLHALVERVEKWDEPARGIRTEV